QQVQRRDLGLFLRYLQSEEGTDQRLAWTPRLARAFQQYLRQTLTPEGRRLSLALFLTAATVPQGTRRLTVGVVNTVWNAVCRVAQVQGRTPHSARHAMGKHIIAKTGNIAAVQQQLGHRQAAYAMQYARTTTEALAQVLDDR